MGPESQPLNVVTGAAVACVGVKVGAAVVVVVSDGPGDEVTRLSGPAEVAAASWCATVLGSVVGDDGAVSDGVGSPAVWLARSGTDARGIAWPRDLGCGRPGRDTIRTTSAMSTMSSITQRTGRTDASV